MEKSGSKNAYTCKNLHTIITVCVDHGTTPMFTACPTCGERAVSRMGDVSGDIEPTHEWFKPTVDECGDIAAEFVNDPANMDIVRAVKAEKITVGFFEHLNKGGLFLRKIAEVFDNGSAEGDE